MSRSRYLILAALASLLLTAAVARAGLIWQTTVDPTSLERTIDFLFNSGFAPTDSGFAVISPFDAAGDPNTSGGGAPGGGNSGGNIGGTDPGGDPNNSGSTGDPGGGNVAPEPGTLILTFKRSAPPVSISGGCRTNRRLALWATAYTAFWRMSLTVSGSTV